MFHRQILYKYPSVLSVNILEGCLIIPQLSKLISLKKLSIGQLFFAGIGGMFQLSGQDCDPIQTYIPSDGILYEVPAGIWIPAGMFEFQLHVGIPPRSSFYMGCNRICLWQVITVPDFVSSSSAWHHNSHVWNKAFHILVRILAATLI